VRVRLAEVLRRLNGKSVQLVRESLEAGDPRRRQRAALALGYLQPIAIDAFGDLLKALADDDALVRASAARSLGRFSLHAKRLGALLNMLAKNDSDARVRAQARLTIQVLAPLRSGRGE
jgi:HEAT repeat protein